LYRRVFSAYRYRVRFACSTKPDAIDHQPVSDGIRDGKVSMKILRWLAPITSGYDVPVIG
jgi:hypothetical protein